MTEIQLMKQEFIKNNPGLRGRAANVWLKPFIEDQFKITCYTMTHSSAFYNTSLGIIVDWLSPSYMIDDQLERALFKLKLLKARGII